MKIRILLIGLLGLMCQYAYSQQSEWTEVDCSNLSWKANSSLHVYSSTLTDLQFYNYNPLSESDVQNNKYTYLPVEMGIFWEESRPWTLSFSIANKHNDPQNKQYKLLDSAGNENWYSKNVYWGFKVTVKNSNSLTSEYTKFYCNDSGDASMQSKDSDSGVWTVDGTNAANSLRYIVVQYDGENSINVYEAKSYEDEFELLHTFNNAREISSIIPHAGPAALVYVQDFSIERMSDQGMIKRSITSGDARLEAEDYLGAAMDYSKAIDLGQKNYYIYYQRGSAYYNAEFYGNAIDDYTKALSYRETEDAYFFRGVAKLMKDDPSGIDDLKRGGAKGLALIKEYGLDGQSSASPSYGQPSVTPSYDQPSYEYKGSGTGFFVDERGYIMTNYHVVDSANGVDVFVSNSMGEVTKFNAKIVVVDKVNDLAIIKVNDPKFSPVPTIPYLIARGTKDVGTSVFTMGYPETFTLGEEVKVTNGIISSKTGFQGDISAYQFSAPIHHGNSGGPLFDDNGNIIGVTSAGVLELQNVSYAIKTSYVTNLIEACSEVINTPTNNSLGGLTLAEKIKKLSPYVVYIKIY